MPSPPPGEPAAAAPADTALRVPGAWMRFGHTQEQILARGPFGLVKTPGRGGLVTRGGSTRGFGIPSDAVGPFPPDRLPPGEFAVKDPPPSWVGSVCEH